MQDGPGRTVLLADDHPIFRTGLRQVIESNPVYRVVSEVGDGRAAVNQIELLQPDFAVFDLNMPGVSGFDALRELSETKSPTRVLIISMHADAAYAKRAREIGAIGFVAKEDAPTEVLKALDEAEAGFFMSQSVGSQQSAGNHQFDAGPDDTDLSPITGAERKVLILLSLGKTSKEIARDLGVSPRTVQAHRRNVAEKLGISGPNKLLEIAVRNRAKLVEEQ